MTEPQPVLEQAEQDKLTRQIGRALLGVVGDGWTQVRAEYRSAGRHVEVDVVVAGPDGNATPVRPPMEVVEGLGALRQGMYRPGRGTWLSALYLLEPPSSFSAEFEPDAEPRWRRVPPPIGFADELRFFPREDEFTPDWLRQRAGLPPAQGEQQSAQPTPPAGQPAPPGGHAQQPGGAPAPPGGQPAPPGGMAGQPGPPAQPTPPGGLRQPSGGTPPGGVRQAPGGTPPGGMSAPGGPPRPAGHPGAGQPAPPPPGQPRGPQPAWRQPPPGERMTP